MSLPRREKGENPMDELLPAKNELGFYEMRFESVGGLGANLAGQILAQAGVLGRGSLPPRHDRTVYE